MDIDSDEHMDVDDEDEIMKLYKFIIEKKNYTPEINIVFDKIVSLSNLYVNNPAKNNFDYCFYEIFDIMNKYNSSLFIVDFSFIQNLFLKFIENQNIDLVKVIIQWLIINFSTMKTTKNWHSIIDKYITSPIFNLTNINLSDVLDFLIVFKYFNECNESREELLIKTVNLLWNEIKKKENSAYFISHYSELLPVIIELETFNNTFLNEIMEIDLVLDNVKATSDFLNKDLIRLSHSLVSLYKVEGISLGHFKTIITRYLTKLTTEKKVKFKKEIAIDEFTSILFIIKEMIKFACTKNVEAMPTFKNFVMEINLIENIFMYLEKNKNILNFVFCKNYEFACAIISNIFYHYADELLKIKIASILYTNINMHAGLEFNNIFIKYLFSEYSDNSHLLTTNSNDSFEINENFKYLIEFSSCYMYMKLLFDCYNGPDSSKNASNISLIHKELEHHLLTSTHTRVMNIMLISIVDNSNFIRLFQKHPTLLNSTTDSSSSYNSNMSRKMLEKIENLNAYYIISLPKHTGAEVLDSNFSQYLLNLTFHMAKIIIKYFNRLSYSLFYMECADTITNASLSLEYVVKKILEDYDHLEKFEDHECIIKMILAIIFLLDDTTFIKNNVSISSRYFISNAIDQNLLGYISEYICKLIDFIKNDTVVDDHVKLFLKLLFFWLKYSSKIIKSKTQLEKTNSQLTIIKSLGGSLIYKVLQNINNIIQINTELKDLIYELIELIGLKQNGKFKVKTDEEGNFQVTKNYSNHEFSVYQDITANNYLLKEYVIPMIDHPIKNEETASENGINTTKRRLEHYILDSPKSLGIENTNILMGIINEMVERANKMKINFYLFINLHILRLIENNKKIDFKLDPNSIKSMIRVYITNIKNEKQEQLKEINKSKKKSELDKTFLLFANAVENRFIERGHIEEVMASCASEISARCFHHLKVSFKVYFKLFLKLLNLSPNEIRQVINTVYYEGTNENDEIDDLMKKFNRLYINSFNFKKDPEELWLRLVLFYIILSYFTKINENKKAEHIETALKDECVTNKSTAWYDYNCDKQQSYLNDLKHYGMDKKKYMEAKRDLLIPRNQSFSQYKQQNQIEKMPKREKIKKDYHYEPYDYNKDNSYFKLNNYLEKKADRGNPKKGYQDKEDNDNDPDDEAENLLDKVDKLLKKQTKDSKADLEKKKKIDLEKQRQYAFRKSKTFTLLPNADINYKYIEFDLTAIIDLLTHFNFKYKIFDDIDKANKTLSECPLGTDNTIKGFIARAKEVGKLNLINKYFDNESLLELSNKMNYEVRSFTTDGQSVSVHFYLRKNMNQIEKDNNKSNQKSKSENKTNNIVVAGNLVGIDPGRTTILTGVEEIVGNYKSYSKSCNNYYDKTLVNVANYQMDLKRPEQINKIQKNMPSLKKIKSSELLESIKYINHHMETIMEYWKNSSHRNWRFRKYTRLQKYMNNILNRLKNKTVGFGDYNQTANSAIKGQKGPIKYMKNFLRRNNANIIDVDEYKTSQLCYKCYAKLGNYYPKTQTVTHFDMSYAEQWQDKVFQSNNKHFEYKIEFREVDRIPFSKFKCCPNLNGCNFFDHEDISKKDLAKKSDIRIIHRDLNAAHNILEKLKRMINNEDEIEPFKRSK